MSSPVLFPQTLLDIKVTPETVLDLYRNCGLPESVAQPLFADLPPKALIELVAITKFAIQGAHESHAKVSDLAKVIRYTLLDLLTSQKGESKGDPK